MQKSLPRWLVVAGTFFAGLVLAPLMHVALPNALSQLAPRLGWTAGRPSVWNLFGLIPVVAGGGLLFQSGFFHLKAMPTRVEMKPTANYLVREGPYRFTRNPVYLAGLAAWLGWAVYYGSRPVLGGAALWGAVTNFLIIPREERALTEVFGDAYRDYLRRTRRWL